MDTDPTKNAIVFKVKRLWRKETFHTEQSPTQAADGIKNAWLAVQKKTGARPAQVQEILSEWEPGEEDAAFLSKTLPKAYVSFYFKRPTADAWPQALAAATRSLDASADQQSKDLSYKKFKEVRERRKTGETRLFPVLRHYQADDVYAEVVVHRQIGPGLAAFLAYCSPTPRDNVEIDYVQKISAGTAEAVDAMFETAWQNLRIGLEFSVDESRGAKLITFSHPSDMAASALGLPEFYQQIRSHLGQEELYVAFPDPATLFATLPNTPAAAALRESVARSNYRGAVTLAPTCYILNESGLRSIPPPLPPA